ncbi:MAG: methionyl-tRNA formyltransferase [Smithella sp.]
MSYPSILFMGTPEFALPALERLYNLNYPIIGVITQPDRPRGRGQKEIPPPVKVLAQKLNLPVFQPEKVKDPAFMEILHELKPEMIVVAAYGQILPKAIIDFPPLKCLNIHPSLLPKYRGAAPINWAIIRGETITGVTIMLMDEGMDSGDILLQQQTEIKSGETYGELHDRLAVLGADLLTQAIDRMAAGTASPQPQESSEVTLAPRITKEMGRINWNSSCYDIVNLIRGLSPIPTAYTYLSGLALKIFAAEAIKENVTDTPGKIGALTDHGLAVAAADGHVLLKEIQLAGKKRMPINDFLRGYRITPNTILDS